MSLSVIRFGSKFGVWDSVKGGYVFGPENKNLCDRYKQHEEDKSRVRQNAAEKEKLRDRYLRQFTASGQTPLQAEETLRRLMPELFTLSEIDSDTGKFITEEFNKL